MRRWGGARVDATNNHHRLKEPRRLHSRETPPNGTGLTGRDWHLWFACFPWQLVYFSIYSLCHQRVQQRFLIKRGFYVIAINTTELYRQWLPSLSKAQSKILRASGSGQRAAGRGVRGRQPFFLSALLPAAIARPSPA
jgi:hypothetical protein